MIIFEGRIVRHWAQSPPVVFASNGCASGRTEAHTKARRGVVQCSAALVPGCWGISNIPTGLMREQMGPLYFFIWVYRRRDPAHIYLMRSPSKLKPFLYAPGPQVIMAAAAPRPSSSASLDDIYIPPALPSSFPRSPHLIVDSLAPDCNALFTNDPPIFASPPSPLYPAPPPPIIIRPPESYVRGRSRSRSPSPSPTPVCGGVHQPPIYYFGSPRRSSYSPESRSPSPPPRRRRRCSCRRSRSPSPIRRSYSPIIIHAPPVVTMPSPVPPPMPIWPSTPVVEPVDILRFHYNKNMAYAPAPKSYDVCPPPPPFLLAATSMCLDVFCCLNLTLVACSGCDR